ncbi:MAG: SDR family oxidoreductase [Deltaproteobacteria bacterium]|nr:SDR family oxidoreductase [Deltaproteobacteria bacterium]MCB9787314.1 SDR family oxidoreductase [Deltaproteobacteria bacterium]
MSDLHLVTGGAGFIGSHITRALLARGDRVRVLDDLSTGDRANLEGTDAELIVGSILDADTLATAIRGCRTVFHLAAQVSVPHSMDDPPQTHEVNTTGTMRVFEAARTAGVARVVFSATCAVYGDEPTLPKRETSVLAPASPYAASKLAGEIYGQVWTRGLGLEVVALRYFNVFGPRQSPEGGYAAAIPVFATRLLAGRPVTIFGDGGATRDFVFIDNVVDANLRAATAPGVAGQVFNIGTGVETSVLDLYHTIREAAGSTAEPSFGPERAGDIRHSVADISRARDVLGWTPRVGIREGLQATVAWYREQP